MVEVDVSPVGTGAALLAELTTACDGAVATPWDGALDTRPSPAGLTVCDLGDALFRFSTLCLVYEDGEAAVLRAVQWLQARLAACTPLEVTRGWLRLRVPPHVVHTH